MLQKVKVFETIDLFNYKEQEARVKNVEELANETEKHNHTDVDNLNISIKTQKINEVNKIQTLLKDNRTDLNACNDLLQKLSGQLLNLDSDKDGHTIRKVYSMLSDVSSFMSTNSEKCNKEDCNIKLKTQRSFYYTKKKSNFKKEKLTKPSSKEKECLRNEILNLDFE